MWRQHHFEPIRNDRCLTTNSAGAEQPHVRQDRFATEAAAFNDLLFDRNRLRHVRLVTVIRDRDEHRDRDTVVIKKDHDRDGDRDHGKTVIDRR